MLPHIRQARRSTDQKPWGKSHTNCATTSQWHRGLAGNAGGRRIGTRHCPSRSACGPRQGIGDDAPGPLARAAASRHSVVPQLRPLGNAGGGGGMTLCHCPHRSAWRSCHRNHCRRTVRARTAIPPPAAPFATRPGRHPARAAGDRRDSTSAATCSASATPLARSPASTLSPAVAHDGSSVSVMSSTGSVGRGRESHRSRRSTSSGNDVDRKRSTSPPSTSTPATYILAPRDSPITGVRPVRAKRSVWPGHHIVAPYPGAPPPVILSVVNWAD